MSPLDVPLSSLQPDEIAEHLRQLKVYIRETPEPNRPGADGQTCIRVALAFCNDPDGEERIASLIDRGADPNLPSPLIIFQAYTMVAKRTEPLRMLINAGLRLNDLSTIDSALMPTQREGPITLLDYAEDIETYLNSRSRAFRKLVEKHAGPLTGRRRFIADTISMLKEHRAVSSREV